MHILLSSSGRRAAVLAAAALALLVAPAGSLCAQEEKYRPAPSNLEARRWFQDARFGLFVHWGVYSLLADGEWVMNQRKIPAKDYEKLAAFFNPIAFDPAEWVALVKAAGMKYITITSKHHDGFAMFDSKVSDWDIVDRTPYGRDVLKALAEECEKQGIKLFFYYSQLDWHHPDYYPRGQTGRDAGRPDSGDFNRYIDFMNAQLTELLTNYGPVAGIWFDGWWDRPDANWRLAETYALIHRLQPAALIGSNHHRAPNPGEDFQMFEKDLPGHNTAGFSGEAEIGDLPLEYCDTISGAWGFNINDRRYKDTKTLVHMLVRAAGYNSNLLLNVGPMPDGRIQPEFAERLREVGAWLAAHGESIYGTRGGPVTPRPWGVTTQKGNTVYVHVLDWPDGALLVPPLGGTVASARLVKTGAAVPVRNLSEGVLIQLPADAADPYATVIALELQPGKSMN
jgi:alpha-L-fucosidase